MPNPKLLLTMQKLTKALQALERILSQPVDTERGIIDASIQRFEFCVELFWKFLKLVLAEEGLELTYPKEIIQAAYQGKLIDDEITWLNMIRDRNLSSYTYDETLADNIYSHLPVYHTMLQKTLENLKAKMHLS